MSDQELEIPVPEGLEDEVIQEEESTIEEQDETEVVSPSPAPTPDGIAELLKAIQTKTQPEPEPSGDDDDFDEVAYNPKKLQQYIREQVKAARDEAHQVIRQELEMVRQPLEVQKITQQVGSDEVAGMFSDMSSADVAYLRGNKSFMDGLTKALAIKKEAKQVQAPTSTPRNAPPATSHQFEDWQAEELKRASKLYGKDSNAYRALYTKYKGSK
jgi:hypothetical protein